MTYLLGFALLPAAPAAAQQATLRSDGLKYCEQGTHYLIETSTPGLFTLSDRAWFAPRYDTRVYFQGLTNLFFNRTSRMDGYVTVDMAANVTSSGVLKTPLHVTTIKAMMGNINRKITAPIENVAVQIEAGTTKLPPLRLYPGMHNMGLIFAEFHDAPSGSLPAGLVSTAELDRLAGLLDGKAPRVTLVVNGNAVTQMDYTAASVTAAKASAIAWARLTAPRLARGMCS